MTIADASVQRVSALQWARLLVAYLLVPLSLFLCSGDAAWWQAWLYSVLIVVAGVGGRVWAEQRHPGITAERQNWESFRNAMVWDKVLAPLMAVSLVFPMVIVAGLDHRYNWSPQYPLWFSLAGFALIAFGYAFSASALAENRFFFAVIRIQPDLGHVVCDTDPYRYVRHPGYAGNILPLFGIVLALGSTWTLIPAALASIVTVIRTGLEDRTLQEELPGYREYAKHIRYRLIPGIY